MGAREAGWPCAHRVFRGSTADEAPLRELSGCPHEMQIGSHLVNSESWKSAPLAWLVHQTPGFGVSGVGQERRVRKNAVRVKGSQMSVEVVKNQGEAFYPHFTDVLGQPVVLLCGHPGGPLRNKEGWDQGVWLVEVAAQGVRAG